jgi:hypothetical protein
VFVNGALAGHTPEASFPLRHLNPDTPCRIEVRTVWEDGSMSAKAAATTFTPKALLPEELPLAELDIARTATEGEGPGGPWAVSRGAMTMNGRRFDAGLGLRAGTEVEFDLKGLFATSSAAAGVDDAGPESKKGDGLEFAVVGDGRLLWASGLVQKADPAKRFEISLAGVRTLVLKVASRGGGGGWRRLQGDWANAKLGRAVALPAAK